jgi:hypothetical protein
MRVGLLGPLGPSDGAFRRSTGSAPKTSQLHAARFRSRKRRFCSCGDHAGLVLGNGCEDVDGEPVRLREIHGRELDAALHEV